MRLRSGWRALAAAALGWLGGVGAASALTLADLNAGDRFRSGDGMLEFIFEENSVVLAGALNRNLENYEVVPLSDGFMIVGAIGVADGFVGELLLDYSVTRLAANIVGAELFFNGVAFGSGAYASVVGNLSTGDSLAVAVSGDGLSEASVSAAFAKPVGSIDVHADIGLSTRAGAQLASVSRINQRFYAVSPEPGTALLLGGGLAGLAALGRSRRRV